MSWFRWFKKKPTASSEVKLSYVKLKSGPYTYTTDEWSWPDMQVAEIIRYGAIDIVSVKMLNNCYLHFDWDEVDEYR